MAAELESRLDRLETEVALLERELAQLRALVSEVREAGHLERAAMRLPEIEEAPAQVVERVPVPGPAPVKERPVREAPARETPGPARPAPVAAERREAEVAPGARPAAPAEAVAPVERPVPATPAAPAEPSRPAAPAAPAAPPGPPRRPLRELAEDWDLVGPRGFAIVGGAVLALGIGFFFVLAANRGWIDARARVALGACASALALAAGLVLRSRYGQYWAALGAVGAGIAGAYATLAAATARYDLLPDALGLPLAGVIAAVATVIAVRWHSEVIAGLGLLGAALAPALQAIDTGMTWESVAFALIVLVATAAVAVPRSWLTLLHAVAAVVVLQGFWLVSEVEAPAGTGTVAMTASLAAVVLAIAVGLQLAGERRDLDPLALTYALVAVGIPMTTTSQLFDERVDRGLALVGVSAIWVVALAVLAWRRKPDLALVVAASGLALTGLGTSLLLSDAALSVTWSVEAVLLAALAARFADARLEFSAILYAALGAGVALGTDGAPSSLFDQAADHLAAVVPLALAAAGAAAAGVAALAQYDTRTETGLLAFVRDVRRSLEKQREDVREILFYSAAALATLATAFALVSASYDWGHVASTALAALVGAVVLGVAGRRRRDALAVAAYLWIGVALVVAFGYDVNEFYEDATETSIGGWSLLAVAAALLGGAYAHRVQSVSERSRDIVAGTAFTIAAATAALGVAFLSETEVPAGLGLLAVAAVYAVVSGGVFRRPGCRNVATILWSLALVLLVGAESTLVTDPSWLAVVIVATAVGVGAIARPLREARLWLAGGSLGVATAAVVLPAAQPWLEGSEVSRHLVLATAACAVGTFALAGLRWAEARWRDLVTVLWAVGILAVLVSERLLVADDVWLAAAIAVTAFAVAGVARSLGEERLWLAGGALATVTTAVVLLGQAKPWLEEPELERRLAIATSACAVGAFAVAALRWGEARWRDLATVLWVTGILALLGTERLLLGDVRATAMVFALTGGALALAAHPLREPRVWTAAAVLVGVTLVATIVVWTPPSHLLVSSEAPGDGLWVLLACLAGLAAVAATAADPQTRVVLEVVAGGIALYGLSLGILEVAERVSSASVETDFERGHTAVSGLWALVGLALLVVGLLRGSSAIRYAGLVLFGLSLAKIFLYDLSSLSSVTRAFSFILVGGLLLAGGFFLQRLSDRLGPPRHP